MDIETKLLNLPYSIGSVPVKRFNSSPRYCKFVIKLTSDGRVPLRLLPEAVNEVSLLNCPIAGEIGPVKAFESNDNLIRFVILRIDPGIEPDNPTPPRSRDTISLPTQLIPVHVQYDTTGILSLRHCQPYKVTEVRLFTCLLRARSHTIEKYSGSPAGKEETLVGANVGNPVGISVGTRVGVAVGKNVGTRVGRVGIAVGIRVGTIEGTAVGSLVGISVGRNVGKTVGSNVGLLGLDDGLKLGIRVGLGILVGPGVT